MRKLNILAVAAVLTLAHGGVLAAGDIDAGKAKAAPCAACHGADGATSTGAVPNIPIIAGQYADYLARALEDYKTGKRNNPVMAGFVANLTRQDREDLAAYFASLKSGLYTVEYSD